MFGFILVFTFVFVIYFSGISSAVFGGDSGDIILASYFGGVVHPPGYPLNTMIGWVFTHLPYPATVAYKANLMSAVLMAIAIGLLFLNIKLLTKNLIISLTAALTLAFTPLFWLYAHVAEVFQLTLVLVGASLYFLLTWRDEVLNKRPKARFLYLSTVFLGLAVFHHQTAILLIPAFLYLIYKTDKKILKSYRTLLKLSGLFLIGFLPYLFIPFAALRQTPINWSDATTLPNFIRLITRADYGTFLASKSFIGAYAKERLLQIVSYFYFVKADFTIFGFILMIIGSFYLFFKERLLFWFLILAILFSGPFFVAYSSFALASEFLLGVWERFILLSYLFLTIVMAFGFVAVLWLFNTNNFQRIIGLKHRKQLVKVIFLFSFTLFPFVLFLINWPKTDLSDYYLGDWLGRDVLVSSQPNSLVFLFDDTVVFNSQYIYYTSGEFSDRRIIVGGLLRHPYYRQQLVRTYKDLEIPEDFLNKESESASFMADLIRENFQKFPIYTFGFAPDSEGKVWISSGLLSKVVEEDSAKDADFVKKTIESAFSQFKLRENIPESYTQFIPGHIKLIYYQAYIKAGNDLLNRNLNTDALVYFEQSKVFAPSETASFIGQGKALMSLGRCSDAKNVYQSAFELDQHNLFVLQQLAKIARECNKDEDMASKFEKLAEQEKLKREPIFKQF